MPRRARVLLSGVPLHLIQRGNNRSSCFYSEADYLFYLQCLAEQAAKHDCAVHALCLMTNHVHLLLTLGKPESVGLSKRAAAARACPFLRSATEGLGVFHLHVLAGTCRLVA